MLPRLLLAAIVLSLTFGCAQEQKPPVAEGPPPFYVPSTGLIQRPGQIIYPYALLARADEPDADFGRAEKAAYGALPVYAISAFTTYTYDSQQIGTQYGYGYRNRYVVQEGISAPLAP